MKKFAHGLLVGGVGLLAFTYAMAYTPGAGIQNTVHDLSGNGTGPAGYLANPPDNQLADPTAARICIFCHAPHNTYKLSTLNGGPGAGVGAGPQAPDLFDYLPLWNHQVTNYLAYDMYQNGPGAPQTGPKASQAIQQVMVPGSTSMLCLSCHDGSIAVNAYGTNAAAGSPVQLPRSQSSGGSVMADTYAIGLNAYLGNHHPIGFDYNVAQGDDAEIRLSSYTMGAAGSIQNHLYNDKMECGTCHSVHNKGNTGESLLWRSDAGSRLCLTCHDKGDPAGPGATTP